LLAFVVRNHQLFATRKPIPNLRRGWALVRVRLAGICNTDVEILRGYHNFRGTPGHEFVGEVQDVAGVSAHEKKRWLGKRVVGEINISCHALGFRPICIYCKRGLTRHCARRKVLGIVNHDGAFAEYLTLPVENLHLVPNVVSAEQAVFVEPLAAACEILDQVPVKNSAKQPFWATANSLNSSRVSCARNSLASSCMESTARSLRSPAPQKSKLKKSAATQPTSNASTKHSACWSKLPALPPASRWLNK
jgi:hypothetical protein